MGLEKAAQLSNIKIKAGFRSDSDFIIGGKTLKRSF